MLFCQYILLQLALLSIQDVNVAQIKNQFDIPVTVQEDEPPPQFQVFCSFLKVFF